MVELRTFLEGFITNSDMIDIVLGCLFIVLASGVMGALGLDIFNKR